jgi:hypothetical protein
VRFRAALMALRMLERGGVALAPLGFSRVGEGRWQPLRLDPSGRGRGSERALATEDGAELRELLDGLEAAPGHGPLAWAVDRFEMGLERESDVEALSDYLLALRALLDGGRGAEPATVALRLAALCAGEEDRRAVQRRIAAAFALEPFVIEGGLGAARGERYVEAVGRHGPQVLVRELEDALRHLLAGVVGEELPADLAKLADETLLRSGEPMEILVRRLADDRTEGTEGVEAPEHAGEPDPLDVEPEPVGGRGRPALAVVRRPARRPREPLPEDPPAEIDEEPDAREEPDRELHFDFDEESESYSAPV